MPYSHQSRAGTCLKAVWFYTIILNVLIKSYVHFFTIKSPKRNSNSVNLFSKIMINHRWADGKLISWSFDQEPYEFKNVYSKTWRNKKSQ